MIVQALEEDQYANSGNDQVGSDADYSGESAKDTVPASGPATDNFDDSLPADELIATPDTDAAPVTQYVAPAPLNKNASSTGLILSDKIILNPSDKKDLENIALVNSVLPDLKSDASELSRLTGKDISSLNQMRESDWEGFSKFADNASAKYFTQGYLTQRLLASPNILAQIFETDQESMIQQMQDDSGKQYVVSAVEGIINTKIDKRIIDTLNYLVRPKNSPIGGAGHWRIQVDKIRNSYTNDVTKFSRESEVAEQKDSEKKAESEQTIEEYKAQEDNSGVGELAAEAGIQQKDSLLSGQLVDDNGKSISDFIITNESPRIVSAHNAGQAFDISQIDDIRCTLIKKRRIGSDTKIPQPPMNIKLLWQTSEGYNKDKAAIDSSFNTAIQRMSQDSITEMLSGLGLNFSDIQNMNIDSFSDVLTLVGQQFLANTINSGTDSDFWNLDLSGTLQQIGGSIIAEALSLPSGPFMDGSVLNIDGLEESLGRAGIEQALGLPYGSLTGENRADILAQIGRERIIQELSLPEGVFDVQSMNQPSLYSQIGARLIENQFGLASGSFNKSGLNDVLSTIGKNQLSTIIAFPSALDTDFGLGSGTTASLKAGVLSLPNYLQQIAESYITKRADVYKNFNGSYGQNDSIFNLPAGTLASFLGGTISQDQLLNAGIFALSSALENGEQSRTNLSNWFKNPNATFTTDVPTNTAEEPSLQTAQIQVQTYASRLGINQIDFANLFGIGSDPAGTFKKIGQKNLRQALETSGYDDKKTQEANNSNVLENKNVRDQAYYTDRINGIKSTLNTLNQRIQSYTSASSAVSDKLNSTIKAKDDALKQALSVFATAAEKADANPGGGDTTTAAIAIGSIINEASSPVFSGSTDLSEGLSSNDGTFSDYLHQLNGVMQNVQDITKSAYEITTGNEQADFKIEDLHLSDIKFSSIDLGGSKLGLGDLVSFLSGKTTLQDLVSGAASAKLSGSLGISSKALKYASDALALAKNNDQAKNSQSFKDIFFRAIGSAALEEQAGVAGSSILTGSDLSSPKSLADLRDGMVNKLKISRSKANNILASGMGLKGFDLDDLMNNSFSAWSSARSKAIANDVKSKLPAGTTEKFITGQQIGGYDQSEADSDTIRLLATKMHVSEAAIKAFMTHKGGNDNPGVNQIYFVDHNNYLMAAATPDNPCQPIQNVDIAGTTIPDNSYVYFDKAGEHIFSTYSAASEYKSANDDKKINYTDEIANAVYLLSLDISKGASQTGSGVPSYLENYFRSFPPQFSAEGIAAAKDFLKDYGSADKIKAALDTFVSDNTSSKPFSDANLIQFEKILDFGLNISTEESEAVFSRQNKNSSGGQVPLDYLKVSGYNIVDKLAASSVNQSIGTQIGSGRLTADDIFNIFNGNSKSVFAKIGSSILDSSLNLQKGTASGLLNNDNASARKCAATQISTNLIGNSIGTGNLDLASLFTGSSVGSNKAESLLGLPAGSLKSGNILGVAKNVGVVKFAEAFQIPVSQEEISVVNAELKSMGENFFNVNAGNSFYQKLNSVVTYYQALGTNWTGVNDALQKTIDSLVSKGSTGGFNSDTIATLFSQNEPSWNNFVGRLSFLDRNLGLPDGTTVKLLASPTAGSLGEIFPINQYVRQVTDAATQNNLISGLIKGLGLQDGSDRQITDGDINNLITWIKDPGDNMGDLYGTLNNIFSWNLDKKAGLPEGTMATILQDPQTTFNRLISFGAEAFDSSLGLTSVFKTLILGNPDIRCGLSIFGGSGDTESCLKSTIGGQLNTLVGDAFKDLQVNFTIKDIAGNLEYSLKNLLNMDGFDSSTFQQILYGDFRPIQLLGAVMNIPQMYSGKDGLPFNLGIFETYDNAINALNSFKFNFSDLTRLVYGDLTQEIAVRLAAEQQRWNQLTNSSYNWTIAAGNATFNVSTGILSDSTTSSNLGPPNGIINIGLNFPGASDTSSAPILNLQVDNGLRITAGIDTGAAIDSLLNVRIGNTRALDVLNAGQAAIDFATNIWSQGVEYKSIDLALHRLDPNIPADFARSMFQGNDWTRTTTLLEYAEGLIRNDLGIDFLPGGFLGTLQNFISDPNSFDFKSALNGLLGSATADGTLVNTIDNYITGKAASIFGVDFGQGTFGGILGFLQTGSLEGALSIAGNKLQSLADIYGGPSFALNFVGGFVDKTFGLPPGTSQNLYNLYQNFKQAEQAFAASGGSGASGANLANAKAAAISYAARLVLGDTLAKWDEQLGLAPGTLSLLLDATISFLYGNWIQAAIDVAIILYNNLFGVYKVEYLCTADGYYPSIESPPSPDIVDNGNLGVWNGIDSKTRERKIIEAAQYKANKFIQNLYDMPSSTDDQKLVPTQVMTGRWEDVNAWSALTSDTICKNVTGGGQTNGLCNGTKAGMWANPQTTAYTHVGF